MNTQQDKQNQDQPAPKVSVGMPAYNSGEFITEAIESILNQTFRDFELIISDNASTDNTQQICEAFARQDSRIRYYRNERNIGASDNYNAVFHHARGAYFKWASSNDLCAADFLGKCVDVLDERQDAVLSYPRARLFTDNPGEGEDYEDNLDLQDDSACARFKKFMANIRLNNVMNGMIRAATLRHTALIKTFFSSDMSLMAEVAMHGKFIEIPDYLFYRRMDEQTATKLKSEEEVLKHYDPDLKNPMLFQNWKIHFEYLSAATRAPVPVSERLCLMKCMLKQIVWDRAPLATDVIQAVRLFPRFIGSK